MTTWRLVRLFLEMIVEKAQKTCLMSFHPNLDVVTLIEYENNRKQCDIAAAGRRLIFFNCL